MAIVRDTIKNVREKVGEGLSNRFPAWFPGDAGPVTDTEMWTDEQGNPDWPEISDRNQERFDTSVESRKDIYAPTVNPRTGTVEEPGRPPTEYDTNAEVGFDGGTTGGFGETGTGAERPAPTTDVTLEEPDLTGTFEDDFEKLWNMLEDAQTEFESFDFEDAVDIWRGARDELYSQLSGQERQAVLADAAEFAAEVRAGSDTGWFATQFPNWFTSVSQSGSLPPNEEAFGSPGEYETALLEWYSAVGTPATGQQLGEFMPNVPHILQGRNIQRIMAGDEQRRQFLGDVWKDYVVNTAEEAFSQDTTHFGAVDEYIDSFLGAGGPLATGIQENVTTGLQELQGLAETAANQFTDIVTRVDELMKGAKADFAAIDARYAGEVSAAKKQFYDDTARLIDQQGQAMNQQESMMMAQVQAQMQAQGYANDSPQMRKALADVHTQNIQARQGLVTQGQMLYNQAKFEADLATAEVRANINAILQGKLMEGGLMGTQLISQAGQAFASYGLDIFDATNALREGGISQLEALGGAWVNAKNANWGNYQETRNLFLDIVGNAIQPEFVSDLEAFQVLNQTIDDDTWAAISNIWTIFSMPLDMANKVVGTGAGLIETLKPIANFLG